MGIFNELMETLRTTINRVFADKFALIFTLIFLTLFIVLSYYSYNTFVKPMLKNKHILNKEFINKDSPTGNDVLIMFFFTEWCPYCKKAKPEWDQFKEYIENTNNTNQYQVKLLSIDCDKSPDVADKYKIEGYPTIKLVYKGDTYDYDAKPTKEDLIKFVETTVQ